MHVRAVKGRRRKGATSYLSTPRLPRHCRPAGIQFDWSELSVSRGLFPVARHGVRGCKAVNLSALIETTADEGNDRGATIPSTARRRRNPFLATPLIFSRLSRRFSHLLSHSGIRNMYIRQSATSSARFHTAAKRVTTLLLRFAAE